MAIFTAHWFLDIIFFIALILAFIAYLVWKAPKYWLKKGVPLATFGTPRSEHISIMQLKVCTQMKNEPFFGFCFLTKKIFMAQDPELVKSILVKDFQLFQNRGFSMNVDREPLAENLFTMTGHPWRNLRVKLTPAFTSGKMRMMFPTIMDVGKQLEDIFEQGTFLPEFEVRDVLARFTTDIISSCAFGIETNSLKNPQAEFRKMGQELTKQSFTKFVTNIINFNFPVLAKLLLLRIHSKAMTEFFTGVVRDTMQYRMSNNVQRSDFLQLLMQLRNQGFVADPDIPTDTGNQQKFSLDEAAAQAFMFFVAGFETSSTTLQFALYELALNPEFQVRIQQEIDAAKTKYGQITYEGMQEMEFLDRFISETLRKYPIAVILIREANTDYPVPNSNVVLDEGTNVFVPVYSLHHNPDYYPNPQKFDPDRFLPEEKAKRHNYVYLPFGEGPRSCIGNRFALMQIKTGIISILSKLSLSPSKSTPIPLEIDPKSDILAPKGNLYFKVTKRL